MNRFLRFSVVAFLAMMGYGQVAAQEVTIDFSGDTDNWGIGTDKTEEAKEFTYNGYTIKLAASSGAYYRWYDTGNILLGKKGATLTLPAFSFDVERIDVVGTSSASASVKQNFYVGDAAVSTETTGAKDVTNQYEIAAAYQAAGNVYTLQVTSAHNTQITKILIWKKGTAKEDDVPTVDNIAAFTALGNGKEAVLKLDGAKVTYANGKYVYVCDATGGMCFYNQTAFAEATNKWQLGGTVTGKVSIYNGLTQMNVTDAAAMTHTDGAEYQPVEIAIADAKNHIADLVKIKDKITVVADGSKFYTDADKSLQIYDNFKIKYTIAEGDVLEGLTGVVIPYNSQIEIAPISDITASVTAIKADQDKNSPSYKLNGQQVSNDYRGLIVKNGKKLINK